MCGKMYRLGPRNAGLITRAKGQALEGLTISLCRWAV